MAGAVVLRRGEKIMPTERVTTVVIREVRTDARGMPQRIVVAPPPADGKGSSS